MAQAKTSGRILMVKRADSGLWAWPAGGVEDGESDERAAYRKFLEKTGYRLGSVGQAILRRNKDDGAGPIDCTTFLTVVPEEFVPVLTEATSWGWFDGGNVLKTAGEDEDPDDLIENATLAAIDQRLAALMEAR
jgi:8-oxo-dGTP pyrophosphatase MutT (NUDIX family)